jgi:hypothetical protein
MFRIEVTTMATVTDDGTEFEYGHVEWDETSYAECANCLKHGKLSDFGAQSKVPPAPEPLREAVLDIKRLASKHDDAGCDPYALLELIEQEAIAALASAKGGAQ